MAGVAHPRRFGLACHLDCSPVSHNRRRHSRLCGEHGCSRARRERESLEDKGEMIGLVLRTRSGVAPLYISVGHMIGLEDAADWTLCLCRGYRLPEPARRRPPLQGL